MLFSLESQTNDPLSPLRSASMEMDWNRKTEIWSWILELKFCTLFHFIVFLFFQQWLYAYWERLHIIHEKGQHADMPFPVQDIPRGGGTGWGQIWMSTKTFLLIEITNQSFALQCLWMSFLPRTCLLLHVLFYLTSSFQHLCTPIFIDFDPLSPGDSAPPLLGSEDQRAANFWPRKVRHWDRAHLQILSF